LWLCRVDLVVWISLIPSASLRSAPPPDGEGRNAIVMGMRRDVWISLIPSASLRSAPPRVSQSTVCGRVHGWDLMVGSGFKVLAAITIR